MSIESWRAEFYPIEAEDVTAENAVAHSIRKWEGLTTENIQRHGLTVDTDGYLLDRDHGGVFGVNHYTCALCRLYNEDDHSPDDSCYGCPLFSVRGFTACFDGVIDDPAPYLVYRDNDAHDPTSMIEWLKRAAAYEAEHKP